MKRIAKNLPADWTPPVDAWESKLPSDLDAVICYIGSQGNDDDGAEFRKRLAGTVPTSKKNCHVEYARFADRSGSLNTVAITYWRNPADFRRWRDGSLEDDLISSALAHGKTGLWVENFPIAHRDIETLFSSDDQTPGIAIFGDDEVALTELHGYYGSMRDRLISSNDSNHESPIASLKKDASGKKASETLKIAAPRNLCAIRSGQDWSQCSGQQRDFYLNEIAPVLRAGMDHLKNNPEETGCIDCRFMSETDAAGAMLDRTFGYAIFRDIADLEAWAKSHPTHLAIFDKFMEYAVAFDNKIDLRLWHEVLVLPQPETFTYVNCSPETGLLPFFHSWN